MTCFADTNILLYFFTTKPSEAFKRQIAGSILTRPDIVLSVQVLREFFVQSVRPTREDRLPSKEARNFVASLRRFPILPLTLDLFEHALDITARHHFSYWDSAIIAAALSAKCDILFTEDLHHGQVVEGLRIINPFKDEAPIDG